MWTYVQLSQGFGPTLLITLSKNLTTVEFL